MAAMMPSGQTSSGPPNYNATVEPDLIDPDDGKLAILFNYWQVSGANRNSSKS